MRNFESISTESFKAAFHQDPLYVPAYAMLRMACYPLMRQRGDGKENLRLVVTIDGVVTDIVEQRQFSVGDIRAVDLGLSKYYFILEGFEGDNTEDLVRDFPDAKVVDVHLEIFRRIEDGGEL